MSESWGKPAGAVACRAPEPATDWPDASSDVFALGMLVRVLLLTRVAVCGAPRARARAVRLRACTLEPLRCEPSNSQAR